MASIDKISIVVSIAIVAIVLGVTASMGIVQDATPVISAPKVSTETSEPKTQTEPKTQADPFAGIANEVRSNPSTTSEKTAEVEESVNMDDTQEKETMKEETHEKETMKEEPAGPTTHSVDIPAGTSVPGCEQTFACYSPADITINAGDTVEWINVDTAAHTVTGGSPAEGPSGVFDSSLVMADAVYAFTFEETGNYDYFCMVHPWMVGSVSVN
jgi:plastocyanin